MRITRLGQINEQLGAQFLLSQIRLNLEILFGVPGGGWGV